MNRHLRDGEPYEEPQPRRRPRRRRVVLADRPGAQRMVRVIGEQPEEVPGGDGLVRWLISRQLRACVRLAVFTAIVLGALPAAFYFLPALADVSVFGLRLPWLVLGFLVYPFMIGVGLWHNRVAERNEKDFIDSLDE